MAMKRCPVCGEKYSDTYRNCPFCEEEDALLEGEDIRRAPSRGRRASRSRQYSLITPTLIVLIILMAALLIYLLYGDQISQKFGGGEEDQNNPPISNDISPQQPDVTTPPVMEPNQEPNSGDSGSEPGVLPNTPGDTDPSGTTPGTPAITPDTTTPSADSGEMTYDKAMALPGGLSLSTTDFTLKRVGETATIRVSGGSGSYTWFSEDDGVASVDQDGKVTAISRGTINVVVTDGSKRGVCIVRCSLSSSTTSAAPSTPSTPTTTPPADTSSSGSTGGALKTGKAVVVNSVNGVRVRSGPGTSYEALATIPNGGSVQVVESAGDGWYKITFSAVGGVSTTGYMKGEFLSNS